MDLASGNSISFYRTPIIQLFKRHNDLCGPVAADDFSKHSVHFAPIINIRNKDGDFNTLSRSDPAAGRIVLVSFFEVALTTAEGFQ